MTAVSNRGRALAPGGREQARRLEVHGRRRVSGRTLVMVTAVLFFSVVGGAVAIQAQRVEAQHRIDQLERDIQREMELNRILRADVAVAESPDRIIEAARELRLVPPGPVVPLVPRAESPATESTEPGQPETGQPDAGSGDEIAAHGEASVD